MVSDDRPSLKELFDDLAHKAGDVALAAQGGGPKNEYQRRGQVFAVVEAPASAELRLRADIAEAARRTPATGGSERGPEWVRFEPPELDDHALDRAEAWFLSAWRAAGEGRPRRSG
jgi:hypothetical protein